MSKGAAGGGIEPPAGIKGFGNCLLWMLATRAPEIVDSVYQSGRAKPGQDSRMIDGQHLPTRAVVAQLVLAGELGTPPADLPRGDPEVDRRLKALRASMSMALDNEPHRFRDAWLDDLAAMCGLAEPELRLLKRLRSGVGYRIDEAALRRAVTDTRRAMRAAGAAGRAAPAGQVVTGAIPQEPPGFIERQALDDLAGAAGHGQVTVVCAVMGLRGVGKTQLAAAYARRRVRDGWGLVGWVNAETFDSMLADLARIAGRLGVADPRGDSRESALRLRDHLQTQVTEALLVFDNAVSPDELWAFLPASGGTQVVVTSTNQTFADVGVPVEVPAYTRPESLRFLRDRTRLDASDGADAVADAVADHPLALAQAAATIRRRRLSYLEYLAQLSRVPVRDLLGAIPVYPYPVAAALLLTVQSAEAADDMGTVGTLLRVIAVMSPDGVPRDLLAGLALASAEADEPGARAVNLASERCVADSLLTWSANGQGLIMHRFLGRVLRERDQAEGRWPGTVATATDLLEARLFTVDHAWARREEGARLISQVEALWEVTAGEGAASAEIRLRLLRARAWGVRQLQAAADFGRALALGTRVLGDSQRLLGPDHRDTLISQYDLAEVHRTAGHLAPAIAQHEQALADRERVLGPGHPDTLISRDSLAGTYAEAGQLSRAITLHKQNLADRQRTRGASHPDTLASQDHLAEAYLSAGQADLAVSLFRQAMTGREQVLGPDHPDTLISRNNLAAANASIRRLDAAITLTERNLADRQRVLGPDHPDTLVSTANLGYLYWETGRLDEAITLLEQNLANRGRVLGPDHPDTLISQHNLAAAYVSAGRLDEGIARHEQNLADRQRVLGPDHPDTFRSRDRLAAAYVEAGRLDEAIVLHGQNLADRVRVLGPGHPDTVKSRDQLAAAHASSARAGRESGRPCA